MEQSKEAVKKIPRSGKKNRTKGHGYEIKISNMLKDLGLVKTKTSRAASKLYDDCGIDHWGAVLPTGDLILTQCKSGYKNSRPKADVEFKNQIEKMKTHFPKGSKELDTNNMQILFHKIDDYRPENHLVTMKYDDFVKLLKSFIDAHN